MSLYGPIVKLEEERRRRRIEELNRRFSETIRHMDAVVKVNEEAYRAKKAVFDAAKQVEPTPAPKPQPQPTETKKKQATKKIIGGRLKRRS